MLTRCLTCLLLWVLAPGAAVSQDETPRAARLALREAAAPMTGRTRVAPARGVDQRMDLPPVEPGAVVTVAVVVPRDRASRAPRGARYSVEAAPGVRVFGALSGPLEWSGEGEPLLPITFTLSREIPAGRVTVAWVTVEWPTGEQWVTALETRTEPIRSLRVAVQAVPPLAAPGGLVELRYQVANLGNAVDTVDVGADPGVGWLALDRGQRHVIPVGGQALGQMRVQVPRSAPLGERRTLRVFAEGRGSRATALAEVLVGTGSGLGPRGGHLPLTVFLGAASPEAGGFALNPVGIAVHGEGELAPGTAVWLAYRDAPAGVMSPALSARLAGPRLQIGVRRPTWSAAAGDLLVETSPLAGYYLGGRGARLSWSDARFRGHGFVGRPTGFDGRPLDGHAAFVRASMRGRFGELGVLASDRLQSRFGIEGWMRRDQNASLQYGVESARYRFSLEGGAMRREEQGRVWSGPAGEARFAYQGGRLAVNTELRRVPRRVGGDGLAESHGVASTSLLLGRGLRALASLFVAPGDRGDELTPGTRRSRAATAGLHWTGRGVAFDVRGTTSEAEAPLWGRTQRRTIVATTSVPLGSAATAEVGVDVGRGVLRDSAYPVRALRSAVRWTTPRTHGWVQANYAPEYAPLSPLQLDVGGAVLRRRVELQWGSSIRLPDRDWQRSTSVWSAADVAVTRNLSLVLGAQYQPWFPGSPWRVSVGVGRRIRVPLPAVRGAAVRGSVYEDLNGNGRRDPGEPGVAGVALRTDRVLATTDDAGRFAIWDPLDPAVPLHVDPASLEMGLILPSLAALPHRGEVDVPVLRAGALELRLVILQGEGKLEEGEPAAGTLVHLVDAEGQRRGFLSDSAGRVSVGGLAPGRYELQVHRPPWPGRPLEPRKVELVVPAGETVRQTLAVPYAPRPIRFSGAPDTTRAAHPLQ